MPMVDADGCRLNVSVEGRDGGPTLMLSSAFGTTMQIWEPQLPALTKIFRIIRYDHRGHGRSDAGPMPYSIERFGKDALAILDDLNIGKAHWCGLSMGGTIGQWLGAHAPQRFDRLIMANAASYFPDPTIWDRLIAALRQGGFGAIADGAMDAWFTADFREREPQIVAKMKAMLVATPVEPGIACCEALRTLDLRALLPKISSPTLVIVGRHDPYNPLAAGELIRSQIPRASLTILDAAHLSNVEQPHAFTDSVVGFLTQR